MSDEFNPSALEDYEVNCLFANLRDENERLKTENERLNIEIDKLCDSLRIEISRDRKEVRELKAENKLLRDALQRCDDYLQTLYQSQKGGGWSYNQLMKDNYKSWQDVVLNLAFSIVGDNKEEVIADWLEDIRNSNPNLSTKFVVKTILMPDEEIVDIKEVDDE